MAGGQDLLLEDLVGDLGDAGQDLLAAAGGVGVKAAGGVAAELLGGADAQIDHLDPLGSVLHQGRLEPLGGLVLEGAVGEHHQPAVEVGIHGSDVAGGGLHRLKGGVTGLPQAVDDGVHPVRVAALHIGGAGAKVAHPVDVHLILGSQHGGKDLHGVQRLAPPVHHVITVAAHGARVVIDHVDDPPLGLPGGRGTPPGDQEGQGQGQDAKKTDRSFHLDSSSLFCCLSRQKARNTSYII